MSLQERHSIISVTDIKAAYQHEALLDSIECQSGTMSFTIPYMAYIYYGNTISVYIHDSKSKKKYVGILEWVQVAMDHKHLL